MEFSVSLLSVVIFNETLVLKVLYEKFPEVCLLYVELERTFAKIEASQSRRGPSPVESIYNSVHNYSTYPMLLHKCSKNVVFLNEICS